MTDNGIVGNSKGQNNRGNATDFDSIVLDKVIFSNVFKKDIRRVYLYKKAERLARALHLVIPAFRDSKALRDRLNLLSIAVVDASVLPPDLLQEALSRELLALSSLLSMARTAGVLSPMNTDIIVQEAHRLLQELAAYEEPKLTLEEPVSLAALAKGSKEKAPVRISKTVAESRTQEVSIGQSKGHVSDKKGKNDRRDAIISILRSKGPSYIKDLSTLIRDVSEKTIQRELQTLVSEGMVTKEGDRRWTTYSLLLPDESRAVIDFSASSG